MFQLRTGSIRDFYCTEEENYKNIAMELHTGTQNKRTISSVWIITGKQKVWKSMQDRLDWLSIGNNGIDKYKYNLSKEVDVHVCMS